MSKRTTDSSSGNDGAKKKKEKASGSEQRNNEEDSKEKASGSEQRNNEEDSKASGTEQHDDKDKDYKIFNDSVHGHIKMHPLLVKIIDTPEFQRLRYIKQLGGGYFVFPGASHNRFEHSIGVAHLAGKLVQHLMDIQPELGITEIDKLCVQIAGLCHNLGHGPFSHVFKEFMEKITEEPGTTKWNLENQSIKIFKRLIREEIETNMKNGTYGPKFTDVDFQFIENLITGKGAEDKRSKEDKGFLFEIVNNKRTGIDVKKMDYISRDCLGLGMNNNFSHERCVLFARVCKVRGKKPKKMICMRDKEAINMYELFHVRYMLHHNAYQHRVVKAIETMIVDALLKANPYFRLDNKTISKAATDDNPTTYLKLTDEILQKIVHSSEDGLKEAQNIIRRIDKRDLYKIVFQNRNNKKQKDVKTDQHAPYLDIIALESQGYKFKSITLNYGSKNRDPIRKLRFYRKHALDVGVKLKKDEVSYLLPKQFEEKIAILFTAKLPQNIHELEGTDEDEDEDDEDEHADDY